MSDDKIAPKVPLELITDYKRISFGNNFDKKNNNLTIGKKYIYFTGVINDEPRYMGELKGIGEVISHGSGHGDSTILLTFKRKTHNKDTESIYYADRNIPLFIEINDDDENKFKIEYTKPNVEFKPTEENNFKPDVYYFKNNSKFIHEIMPKLRTKYRDNTDLSTNGSFNAFFSFDNFNKTINEIKKDTPIIYHIFGQDHKYISSGQKTVGELREYIGNIEKSSKKCFVIIINDDSLIKNTSEIDNKKEQQQQQEKKKNDFSLENVQTNDTLDLFKKYLNNNNYTNMNLNSYTNVIKDKAWVTNENHNIYKIINILLRENVKNLVCYVFDDNNNFKNKKTFELKKATIKAVADVDGPNINQGLINLAKDTVLLIYDSALYEKVKAEAEENAMSNSSQGGNRKSRKSKKSQKTKKAKKSRKKKTRKRNRKTRRH
jgi:hypothetical protein